MAGDANGGGSGDAASGAEERLGGDERLGARPVADSEAVMTTPVLPADTNAYGNIFGGHLLALIDKTASITAFRHARRNVVTASIDRVDFREPVRLGDILTVRAHLNFVGRTSMEVEVDVSTEDRLTGAGHSACSALLTFVAVDTEGRPTPVPAIAVRDEQERRRFTAGSERARRRREERASAS